MMMSLAYSTCAALQSQASQLSLTQFACWYDQLQWLGSSFCFDCSDQTKWCPDNIFSTIAHDLARACMSIMHPGSSLRNSFLSLQLRLKAALPKLPCLVTGLEVIQAGIRWHLSRLNHKTGINKGQILFFSLREREFLSYVKEIQSVIQA